MNKIIRFATAGSVLVGLIAVPALADNVTSTATSTATSTSTSTLSTPNLAALQCVQIAVNKRETAVQSAWSAFSGVITSAFSARASALNAAWGQTDRKARRDGIRDAWKTFDKTQKESRKTLRSAQKDAWKTFKTDRKSCGVKGEEGDSEKIVE